MPRGDDHRRIDLAAVDRQFDNVVFFEAKPGSGSRETMAALSQLRLVTGLGNSWSQLRSTNDRRRCSDRTEDDFGVNLWRKARRAFREVSSSSWS